MLCYCSLSTHNIFNHRAGRGAGVPDSVPLGTRFGKSRRRVGTFGHSDLRRHPPSPAKWTIVSKSSHETPRARPVHNHDAPPLCCDMGASQSASKWPVAHTPTAKFKEMAAGADVATFGAGCYWCASCSPRGHAGI